MYISQDVLQPESEIQRRLTQLLKQAEEEGKQDEESRGEAVEQAKQPNLNIRRTLFKEYLYSCHSPLETASDIE